MKTKRYLLAVAAFLAIAGCSGDVTTPDPSLRAPDAASSAAAAPADAATTTATEPATTTIEPIDDNGSTGSGCCSSHR